MFPEQNRHYFSTALIGPNRINTISGLVSVMIITMTITRKNIISHTGVDNDHGKSPTQSFSQDEDAQYCTMMVAKEQVCGIMNINKAMAIKSSYNVRGLGHSTFFHNQQDSLLIQLRLHVH